MKTILILSCYFVFSFFGSPYLNLQGNEKQGQQNSKIPAPKLYSPGYNTSFDSVCTFKFTGSGKKCTYEIWVADNAEFNSCAKFTTKDTNYVCKLGAPTNNSKFAKVRAWKNAKSYSTWSNTLVFSHGDSFKEMNIDQLNQYGCNHNCGSCKRPCGRNRRPVDYNK